MRQKKIVILAVIFISAIAVTATTNALMREKPKPETAAIELRRSMPAKPLALAQSEPAGSNADLIHQGAIASQLHAALRSLGDRLERPGKERLLMTGLLQRSGDAQASPFALIWESPGRARIEEQRQGGARVLVFDGQAASSSAGNLDQGDTDLLESVVFDSVERFFISQTSGAAATRFLGSRFRIEGDSASAPYDLVEISETIGLEGNLREQTRTYYFNSDTHLLERLRYKDIRNGLETDVEVLLSDWRSVAGQQVAHRIERMENGSPALTLIINSAVVGPRMADGLFAPSR